MNSNNIVDVKVNLLLEHVQVLAHLNLQVVSASLDLLKELSTFFFLFKKARLERKNDTYLVGLEVLTLLVGVLFSQLGYSLGFGDL